MNKILTIDDAIKAAQKLRHENKKIVVVGGFFDILHIGHTRFLEKAKKEADALFILLESDEKAKKIKGDNRPFNPQYYRAEILSSLSSVDYVINLPSNFSDYDSLIKNLMPDFIAVTEKNPTLLHAKRQAEMVNAKVIEVIPKIENVSSTNLLKLIHEGL